MSDTAEKHVGFEAKTLNGPRTFLPTVQPPGGGGGGGGGPLNNGVTTTVRVGDGTGVRVRVRVGLGVTDGVRGVAVRVFVKDAIAWAVTEDCAANVMAIG